MTRTGGSSGKRWTAEDDDELRRVAPFLTYDRCARLFPGRSREAVKRRLTKLGLYAATGRTPGTYTLMEVATILGAEWSCVRYWVDAGVLPCVRCPSLKVRKGRGGRILIVDAELDAFITHYPFLFSLATFPEGPHKATLILARPQDWLSLQQVSRALGIGRHVLTYGVRTGQLTCRRFGPHLFFHRAEIERYRHERARKRMAHPRYARRWPASARAS